MLTTLILQTSCSQTAKMASIRQDIKENIRFTCLNEQINIAGVYFYYNDLLINGEFKAVVTELFSLHRLRPRSSLYNK